MAIINFETLHSCMHTAGPWQSNSETLHFCIRQVPGSQTLLLSTPVYGTVFPLTLGKKNPVPAQKKPRKPQFFPSKKIPKKSRKCPKKSQNTCFQGPKVPFFPSVQNSRPGRGGVQIEIFPVQRLTPPLGNLQHSTTGGGKRPTNPAFPQPNIQFLFNSNSLFTSSNTKCPPKKTFFSFSSKKPQILPFLDKKTQVVFQKPHFSTKKPQNPSRS